MQDKTLAIQSIIVGWKNAEDALLLSFHFSRKSNDYEFNFFSFTWLTLHF